MRRRTRFAIGLLLCAVALPAHPATITVTNTNDSGAGSLRQALAVAHDGDRITFAVSGTITLTSGALVVAESVTISGPGADQLSIVGIPFQSVFAVAAATISGLTIRNGAVGIDNFGGGTVKNCVISGMSVAGIHNVSSLTVVNSNVSDNDGWGIYNITGEFGVVTATILSTTVSGNPFGGVVAAPSFFGGRAYITITDCTISGNSGGIVGAATLLTVANSTISGNSAGTSGGGISTSTTLRVANCTITGNSAPSGGGIYNVGSIEVSNTILNAGASGENIFNDGGTITSLGYNLSSDDGGGYLTGPGDQINTDPLIGPLQDNGGPTLTHALLPASPAIDAGDPNFAPPPSNDQRDCHFDRVFNGRIDIGSFETQPPPRPCSTPRPRPTPAPRP
jgi:predicted outer membrane repeat protein